MGLFEREISPGKYEKIIRTWDFVVEPPIGIEPMTYALRGACSPASDALAALIARVIARTALAALGLSGDPVHEPVHVRTLRPACCYCA